MGGACLQPEKEHSYIFAGEWVQLEIIILDKFNQSQKDKFHIFLQILDFIKISYDRKVEEKLCQEQTGLMRSRKGEEVGGEYAQSTIYLYDVLMKPTSTYKEVHSFLGGGCFVLLF